MESYLLALDEYFASQYSDYVKINAIEGYKMPDMLIIGSDGNVSRKSETAMRICHQQNWQEVLENFKAGLEDTYFTFSFSRPSLWRRFRNLFKKDTFAKLLPKLLAHTNETVQSVGEKLAIDGKIWQAVIKGRAYPEKNTVIAIALVARMGVEDVNALLSHSGYVLQSDCVRDVVVGYLLGRQIFNEEMQKNCLSSYKITSLPIRRAQNA